MRRSEITAINSSRFERFALKAESVSVLDSNGRPMFLPEAAAAVQIVLRESKTNQVGKPVVRLLSRSGRQCLCPVLGALLLLRARGDLPGSLPAATFKDDPGNRACITSYQLTSAIKAGVVAVGIDPSQYSSHSLRVEGATHMYRAGVDPLTIQFHGCWTSDAYKIYTSLRKESALSIAAKIVSGANGDSTLTVRSCGQAGLGATPLLVPFLTEASAMST